MTCKRVREFPHFQEEPSTPDASSVFTPSFVKDKFKKSPLISENDNSISLNVFDPDTLVKPVKSFIAEFVRKQLLRLSSQTIGQLLCVFISMMGVGNVAPHRAGADVQEGRSFAGWAKYVAGVPLPALSSSLSSLSPPPLSLPLSLSHFSSLFPHHWHQRILPV